MAMQKRIKLQHGDVFPMGAFLKGSVEPVADFNAEPSGGRVAAAVAGQGDRPAGVAGDGARRRRRGGQEGHRGHR